MQNRGAAGGSGLREAAALPHSAVPATPVPLGHAFSHPAGSRSVGAGLPAPASGADPPLALSCPEAESRGPVPTRAAEVSVCYSPQLFLSLRVLAMVVWGPAAARRSHCAGSSPGPQVAGGGRLCARAGRSCLRLRGCCCGAGGEEWGGEGRRQRKNQAQHHKPEFTHIAASHPPYLSPPPEHEDRVRRRTATFSMENTHTNKQHPSHTLQKN